MSYMLVINNGHLISKCGLSKNEVATELNKYSISLSDFPLNAQLFLNGNYVEFYDFAAKHLEYEETVVWRNKGQKDD